MKNPRKANDYNAAAMFLAKNNEHYEWALQLAKKALKLSKKEPVANTFGFKLTKYGIKLAYLPENKAKKQRKYRNANILATMGLIYMKQGQYDKAETTLKKAVETSDESIDAKEYLASVYQKTNRPQKAFEVYSTLLITRPNDKSYFKKLKKNYTAFNGSNKGFKKQIKKVWRKAFKQEQINKEAPSLAHATDLTGTPLDTTTLAGKVIVLDFWATWCKPCNQAFPHLQKVYEKYKNNPNVKFVILDCAVHDTKRDVKQWTKNRRYTFPIYYDKGSKITRAFGVQGFPTTIVINQSGRIQFKEIGYHGPSMEQTLALKIEMVLDQTDPKVK